MNLILIFLPLYLSHSKPSATLEPKFSSKAHYIMPFSCLNSPVALQPWSHSSDSVGGHQRSPRSGPRLCPSHFSLTPPHSPCSRYAIFPATPAHPPQALLPPMSVLFLASEITVFLCPVNPFESLYDSAQAQTSQKFSLSLFSLVNVKCRHST